FAVAGTVEAEVEIPDDGDEPGWSREAAFRKRSFERCDDGDLAAMEPILERIAERLATRRSRRLVPTPGRGRIHLRRSLRRSLAPGGELVSLARRTRPVETPRIILLCDTSGSMEAHTRFILAFARALRRVADRTEVFAFNTELQRVTPWLAIGDAQAMIAHLRASVPDWSGGTRIGECLDAVARRHLRPLADSRTVGIIL